MEVLQGTMLWEQQMKHAWRGHCTTIYHQIADEEEEAEQGNNHFTTQFCMNLDNTPLSLHGRHVRLHEIFWLCGFGPKPSLQKKGERSLAHVCWPIGSVCCQLIQH